MQENPEVRSGEGDKWSAYVPGEKSLGENTFLKVLQRPRIVLLLLLAWSVITVIIEAWPESDIFFNVKRGDEIDGALAGGILMWQGIPLALLYFLSFRHPEHNKSVFWVGLVQQAAAIAANIFAWGTGTFTVESIIIPVAVSAGLGALVFVNVFGRDELAEAGATPGRTAPG
jgi:hypothetical protein